MTSNITMQSFAVMIKISTDHLIRQFSKIGIFKTKSDFVTPEEKEIFFKYMSCKKSTETNKLVLQRTTRSTLNISSVGGKNKQVQIEVRKKRTYVRYISQESESVLGTTAQEQSSFSVDKKSENFMLDSECNKEKIEDKGIQSSLLARSFNRDNSSVVFNALTQTSESEKFYNFAKKTCPDLIDVTPKLVQHSNIERWNISESATSGTMPQHYHIKKNDHRDYVKLSHISVETEKNNDQKKPGHENRPRSRMRPRYKSGGKLIKQNKKTNIYRAYVDVYDESGKDEELCTPPNRINKNKRKQSVLMQRFNKPTQVVTRDIIIGETISVLELANKMSVKSSHVIKVMMELGLMVTINQVLDQETAQLVVEEMGHNVILRRENFLEESVMNDCNADVSSNIIFDNRAPIVTMMGHVDHGKTSLLDRIRSTKTAASEVGGITQSVGAYRVNTANGTITFLDTPGHEAFASMRARGAQLTDVVVLVIAADDGVMPQTIEAIQHAQASDVPIVVAINKIDKLNIDFERIKNELNYYGLVPEEWGGSTQLVNVSAISGLGINNLLDSILLQSAMLELKVAHRGVMAKAVVIDAALDKGRGPIASILVREGTLKCGDVLLCGTEYGRVRAMRDEYGYDIVEAGPSVPVAVLGLSGVPIAGEAAIVVRDEKKAKEVALYRQSKYREIKLAARTQKDKLNIKSIFSHVSKDINKAHILNFIVKSDTQGSMEAICEVLKNLSTHEIRLTILFSAIGDVTETDAALAITSNAVILGFNVKADMTARRIIELENLDVRYYLVIYDLLNDVKKIIHSVLTPKYKCEFVGVAKVHSIFRSTKYGTIAGCVVTSGMVKNHKKIKIVRNNTVMYEGELESLRHFKNDVNEVKIGTECGIGIKNYNDIKPGDVIEVFDLIETVCCSS